MRYYADQCRGYTIVELLISLVVTALMLTAMTGLVNGVLVTDTATSERSDANQEARFAMQRMVSAVAGAETLLLPLVDNPSTNWRENVREQSVPAAAPEGDSTLATAVLAVSLDPSLDIDANGVVDADNDADGEVDENPGKDMSNDGEAGIKGIDDDGDGDVDEQNYLDDDEDGGPDEDIDNTVDDDGDGSVDEDFAVGWGDDWYDPVVFFLNGTTLMERRPDLNPSDGADYTEFPIADDVSYFGVERLPDSSRRATLLDITLEVSQANGESVRLNTRIRLGAAR